MLAQIVLLTLMLQPPDLEGRVADVIKKAVMHDAVLALRQAPVTVTAVSSLRSAGGKHDFFSEGDYWWPNPAHPDSPYIQRDGMSNPDNFVEHRRAMVRFSRIMGSLGSAWKLTGDARFVRHAMRHARAWFMDTATRMNPSLNYAQAIKGRFTGRAVGVIDMIQMLEVAQSLFLMGTSAAADKQVIHASRQWFREYLQWVTTHPYGVQESNARNNHGTCWVMQVAVFARFTGDLHLLDTCRRRFRDVLLPLQLARDGSFPLELARTKPYGYSLFNMDAMAVIAHVLSSPADDFWNLSLPDGQSLRKAVDFLFPFVADKSKWPYKKDVMYWDDWPVAHPFLLFAYQRFKMEPWFDVWRRLSHFPTAEEVIRNLPIRNPLLWI